MQFKNILLFFFTKIFGGSVWLWQQWSNKMHIWNTPCLQLKERLRKGGRGNEWTFKESTKCPLPWGSVGGVLGMILWNRVKDEHIGQEWLQHHWLVYSPFNGFHPITLMKFVICWKHYIV
jgi:hypothetical protein